MEKIKTKIQNHSAYNDFVDSNEKFMSELTGTIRDIITNLNSKNSITDDVFNKFSETIEVSNAVFRSFSNHEGLELILRLKSISELYKKNLKDNSSLIRIAEHLLKKLEKFNSNFYHEASADEIIYPELPPDFQPDEQGLKKSLNFKWITFERNGSLFISRFKNLEIFNYFYPESENPWNTFNFNGKTIVFSDLMKVSDSESKAPLKVIIIDKGSRNYAADHCGREIHGTYDMITPLIEPLEVANKKFYGRVRIFGHRYLVIRHD